MIPARKKRPKMNLRESTVIRCPGHLKWVRGHECCIAGKWRLVKDDWGSPSTDDHVCEGRIEAHHVREGDHGQGMGQKPDDSSSVPLCSKAHKRLHDKGSKTFEKEWRVDLSAIAAELWKHSPHRIKFEKANAP